MWAKGTWASTAVVVCGVSTVLYVGWASQPRVDVDALTASVTNLELQIQQLRQKDDQILRLVDHSGGRRGDPGRLVADDGRSATVARVEATNSRTASLDSKTVRTTPSTTTVVTATAEAAAPPALSSLPQIPQRPIVLKENLSNVSKISPKATSTSCDAADPVGNLVTFIVQNPRTGSLFMSGRLQKFGSGRFTYDWVRAKTMKPRPFGAAATTTDWLHHVCGTIPGYKVIVYDSGASPNWWLSNWPPNTALVMTGDEMGRWGLYSKSRYWGPFGTDRESFFEENTTSPHRHILLPPTIRPWFRQYYDFKQEEAFGSSALFIPLGSRVEFPDITDTEIIPASERKYIYVLMMALTDNSRAKLRDSLKAATAIPESRTFVHIAEQWHPELTNEEYVNPAQYAKYLLNSVFTPCPKGRSLDTFRLYEAMEAGSIPVIELGNGYAKQHLPPAFFDSPILFVETWDDAPAAMLELLKDPATLNARQKEVRMWYTGMMKRVVAKLEAVLLSRRRICYTEARDSDCNVP